MLKGWKGIAAHLRRDERTAMRWAAERGLPVHRMPGPGRGSVYALAEEIDAWLARDRERAGEVPQTGPSPIAPVDPAAARPQRWWRGRWAYGALIAAGASLITIGALGLRHPGRGDGGERAFTDPVARAMFLKASYDWNLRTRESLTRATQEYSAAIGRDPRVAAAYLGLANCYLLLREYGSMADADAYGRAEAAARAALALSPASADAHRALAFVAFWWRQDRETARGEFARAVSLKPDDPLTHHWLATALLANGEAQAALREIDKAREIDPGSTSVLADYGMMLYVAGSRAEGLAVLRGLAREQPGAVSPHRSLAEIALYEGRADEFLRESETAARLRGDTAGLAEIARWRSGGSSAPAVEQAMLRDARRARGNWFLVARVAALAGRRDDAEVALARACGTREPAAISASSDLWLSRAVSSAAITARCGHVSLLS